MYLRRLDTGRPDFEKLDEMLKALDNLLDGRDSEVNLEELIAFQKQDGSFSLFEPGKIPHEAVVDFVNTPTYMATAVLMKEYLKGNKGVAGPLKEGLAYTCNTGLQGHGYDELKTEIHSLKIFIRGGLHQFLLEERELYPPFNCLVLNLLHRFSSRLSSGCTMGPFGADYEEDWQMLVKELKLPRRFYVAYGSNMNKQQMGKRCPDARVVESGYLPDWRLRMPFYANIEPKRGDKVPVLVWEISDADERNLDRYEGYPHLYDKRELLLSVNGKMVTALAYIMTDEYNNHHDGKIRSSYEETIKQGYADAGFDRKEYNPDR